MDSNAVLRLTETDGGGNSTELPLVKMSESTITIGRGGEADIRFGEGDQSVSRHQFEVSFRGGSPTLKNTGRNPVVYKSGRKQLASGAEINIDSGLEVTFRESKLRFDVEVPEVYCLKTKGAGGRAEFEIERDRKYTVGRSPECDITLDSSGVSRRHCRLQLEAGEVLNVHDLGSVNGVRLFLKGELQPESPDMEVPCGVKFLIGDIECVLEKKGQESGGRKPIALPAVLVVVLLLLISSALFLVLKPGGSDGPSVEPDESSPSVAGTTQETGVSDLPLRPTEPPRNEEESARQRNIDRIQAIIRDDASFDKKAYRFAGLAKDSKFKSLVPFCKQLDEYYSQCGKLEKMNVELLKEYEKRMEEARGSIERLEFDFSTSLSFGALKNESDKLMASYATVSSLLQGIGLEAPEFPAELTVAAADLVEKARLYQDETQSISYIWTDLENSSFDAPSKFKEKEMKLSIDALYPGEGIAPDVCAKIGGIINYREQMWSVYQGLIDQVGTVLTNYTESGESKVCEPERWVMQPLRTTIDAPVPNYYGEPPPLAAVSSYLYGQLEAISSTWTNLEFLTHCSGWKSGLEQRQLGFGEIDRVLPLVDRLCVEASLKSAADLDAGLNQYRQITDRLKPGDELDLSDAKKLILAYNLCHRYLEHEVFSKLREESTRTAERVGNDCLMRVVDRLKKECAEGLALDGPERDACVDKAGKILEILDLAVSMPPEFETQIKGRRDWVESKRRKI